MSGDKHFNANKIFIALLVFTVLEVAWGLAGAPDAGNWNKLMLWGGLMFFAFLKAWYIAVYFMHLKFEGWVIKSLILPTPFLIMVIMGYVMGDVNEDTPTVHPIGSMMMPDDGRVEEDIRHVWVMPGHGEEGESGDH